MTFVVAAPAGMRDLLPPEAAHRARLSSRLTRLFESHGYQLVTTAPFEHEGVIERGLDTLDRRDLLRFVDPESGEVAVLRPDLTPQVARIVATRLADRPAPYRLCTSGLLVRRRRGRARLHRQIMQAGVELVGVPAPEGDVEVIKLAAAAMETAGLDDYAVELSLTALARALLDEVHEDARGDAEEALLRKDRAELDRVLARSRVSRALRARLAALPTLHGDRAVLRDARRVFPQHPALAALRRLIGRLDAEGLGGRLVMDLGEARGATYYTGASFSLIARGPGEPIGSGGRYDSLIGRFGQAMPATGFVLDLAHLEWACRTAGVHTAPTHPPRMLVSGGSRAARDALATRLRDGGAQVATLDRPRAEALDYARAWGYDAAVFAKRGGARMLRLADAKERALPGGSVDATFAWVRRGKA